MYANFEAAHLGHLSVVSGVQLSGQSTKLLILAAGVQISLPPLQPTSSYWAIQKIIWRSDIGTIQRVRTVQNLERWRNGKRTCLQNMPQLFLNSLIFQLLSVLGSWFESRSLHKSYNNWAREVINSLENYSRVEDPKASDGICEQVIALHNILVKHRMAGTQTTTVNPRLVVRKKVMQFADMAELVDAPDLVKKLLL